MNPTKTHGAFSWSELMTPDTESGAAFYRKLFGWTTEVLDMGNMMYTMASLNGAPVAGMMGMVGPDIPPNWAFYVTVDDVDACAAKATELGAKIQVPPMDVPNVGRFVGFFDPQGAFVSAITYTNPDMPSSEEPDFRTSFVTNGAFSWFELRVPDIEAAVSFYTQLFGWNVKPMEMPTGLYHVINVGDTGVGGIFSPPPGQEMPPHWGAFVTVGDVDATAKVVEESGGKLVVPPTDVPEVGRFIVFADPQGAMLAAIKYVPMNG